MSRTDSFAIGAIVVTATLTVIIEHANTVAVWVLLVVGIAIMSGPYFLDWRYGEFRPTKAEIGAMTADEFKRRLHNPKFEKYVNRLMRSKLSIWLP